MHLRRLELLNFRRYASATIEFPDGVIGLVGRNGTGKSTIIEAVTWALFGAEAARTKKELVKRHGAAPGEACQVVLEFDIDGEAYRVTRRMRGVSLQVDMVIEAGDRLLVAGGPNSTAEGTRYLEKLLGFDRQSFYASVVARQGELGTLSELTPGARKRLVLRMLGIDAIEDAIGRARNERREAETELGFVRQAIAEAVEHSKRQADVRTQIGDAKKELKDLTGQLAAATQKVDELGRAHARLLASKHAQDVATAKREAAVGARQRASKERVAVRAELAGLGGDRKRLDTIEARLEALRPEAARVDELEATRASFHQVDGLGRQRKALDETITHLAKSASEAPRLTEKARTLEAEAKAAAARVESLAEAARLAAGDRAGREERLRSLRTRLQELEQQGHQIDALGEHAACPLCARPLGEALTVLRGKRTADHDALTKEASAVHTEIAVMEAKEREAVGQREQARARKEAVAKDLDSVRRRRDEAERAAREADVASKEREAVVARIDEIGDVRWEPDALARARAARQEAADLEKEAARLSERVGRQEDLARRLEQAAVDEAGAERTIQEATAALEALAPDVARLEACAGQLEDARARREALGRKEAGLEERARTLATEEARLADLVAAGAARRARGKELEATVRLMEFLASAHGDKGFLQAFKTHLISRIRPALARAASDLLAAMTDGRYMEMELDDEYEVSVYDGGEAHPLARFSGGETDVVNLALRLAINELVSRVRGRSRMDFIALDEVFGAQDAQRRLRVLASLSGLRRTFRQVLVITHHEEVQERLEHVINVVDEGAAGTRLVVVGLNKV